MPAHPQGLSARFRGLWRHSDFLKLWAGQTVSVFGSQISQLAVPTVAILVLKATPFQVGLLGALQFLAFPTLGLLAGVWSTVSTGDPFAHALPR